MSDYNFLMESRLSPEQYRVLNLMGRVAAAQGLNLYLVGGAVRDLTYGQQVVRDLDFGVEGNPQKILRSLPEAAPKKKRRKHKPGGPGGDVQSPAVGHKIHDARTHSAELRFDNGVRAELAMCRQEIYSRAGHRPEIRPAMVFDDLKRRDFSINAMAVSLHPNSRGLLLDPTNGAADIERRELRALHSRSLLEDPSRIYRLLRFKVRLGFSPDERTERWLATAMEDRAWDHLDPAQQARELREILYEDNPGRVLKSLAEQRILSGLDKKLALARIPFDRFTRIHSVVQSVPGADPFLLNVHCMVEKLGGAHKARLAKKVAVDSQTVKLVLSLDRDARKLERTLASSKASLPSHVYMLLNEQPLPLLLFILVNSKRAKVQNRVKSFIFKFPQIRARLPRMELQSLGLKPGPEYNRILERIFFLQLDGKIKTQQQLMKELRALAGIKEPPKAPPPKAPVPKGQIAAVRLRKKGEDVAGRTEPSPKKPVKPAGSKRAGRGLEAAPERLKSSGARGMRKRSGARRAAGSKS